MSALFLVHLYAYQNDLAALRSFEAKVLPIVLEHGGELEAAFTPSSELGTFADQPDEVHILRFPSHGAFRQYQADPRHAALADERKRAIARTEFIASGCFYCYD